MGAGIFPFRLKSQQPAANPNTPTETAKFHNLTLSNRQAPKCFRFIDPGASNHICSCTRPQIFIVLSAQ